MSVRSNLTWYYGTLGLPGLLAISSYRVFGQPREVATRPPGFPHRIHLRLKTTDMSAYSEILLRGLYDFELPFTPKTVVDAGANIGMASIYFAHRYPEAKIVAIEAEGANFDMLAKNVRPYSQITPVHAALWNRDGEISVTTPNPDTGAFGEWGFVTHDGPGSKVRAITMPTLMKEMQIPSIDLLKMDIEGAEKEVFESCNWVDNMRCMMIELHDRHKPGCSEAVHSACAGFSVSQREDTTVYLKEA